MLFKYTIFYKHTAFSSQPQYANDFSILSLVLYAYNMFKIIAAAVINIATSEGLARIYHSKNSETAIHTQ